MVSDPYKVLEINENATPEEIKKAYRRLAKKYHPDLNPNDSTAAIKMTEINEAYDMLTNPDKYKNMNNQNGSQQTQNKQHQYQYGYSGNNQQQDAYGFDFESIFGFMFDSQTVNLEVESSDSVEIKKSISLIKNRRYEDALSILNDIISTNRNARWYFVSSYANYHLNKEDLAFEQIKKALELSPNNQNYKLFYKKQYQEMQRKQSSGQVFNPLQVLFKLFKYYIIFQIIMFILRMLLGGF